MNEIIKELEEKINLIDVELEHIRNHIRTQRYKIYDEYDLEKKKGYILGLRYSIIKIKESLDKQSS